jgi:hypothetical protein
MKKERRELTLPVKNEVEGRLSCRLLSITNAGAGQSQAWPLVWGAIVARLGTGAPEPALPYMAYVAMATERGEGRVRCQGSDSSAVGLASAVLSRAVTLPG